MLAVRFVMGIVLCIINGRDGWYVAQETWEHIRTGGGGHRHVAALLCISAVQGLLALFLVASTLFEPVFMLSQSFPDTSEFIATLSAVSAAIAASFGASIIQIYHHVMPLSVVADTRRVELRQAGVADML